MGVRLDSVQRKTRTISVGSIGIGAKADIAIQSMCATRTTDIDKTVHQIIMLQEAGADLIRLSVDTHQDVEALKEINRQTTANLVIDLQENYRLAKDVAPYVCKFRYNPGHLYHHEKELSIKDKVRFLVDVAKDNDCAIRIGVNFGSLDPTIKEHSHSNAAVRSSIQHCEIMEELGFTRYLVSLKSSSPEAVIAINRAFASACPEVPLHLGVTEAGMLPEAEIKSRMAMETLLAEGIGDTIRVSITLPYSEKAKEVVIGEQIVRDVQVKRFSDFSGFTAKGVNVISCPSCSRVENESFVQLAKDVKEVLSKIPNLNLTVAVMGCRVNGPGETDDADIGLWCAANHVNLKKKDQLIGAFSYTEIIEQLLKIV